MAALLWHFFENGTLSYGRLVLACGVSWILLPPIVLLIHLGSWWAALIMVLTAAVTAPPLRRLVPTGAIFPASPEQYEQRTPFAMLPVSYSGIWLALAIAAAIEGAASPLAVGRVFVTGLLLSAAIFALLWQRSSSSSDSSEEMRRRQDDRGSTKLTLAFLFADLDLDPGLSIPQSWAAAGRFRRPRAGRMPRGTAPHGAVQSTREG